MQRNRRRSRLPRWVRFYAGGHYDTDHPDHHIVGQIYVEYQIPAQRRHAFPIVMVHGGGQTGAGWWSTPDGRPGWAQFFLRRGYAVYVVDQIGRGRSPFTPEVYGETSSQSLDYVAAKIHHPAKLRLWPQAALHTQWPGAGKPGDEAFDQYFASEVPGMENRIMQTQWTVDALAKLLDRIGPSIVLVHSQSGAYAWPLAQLRPKLVTAIVAAEPAGPPVHDVVVKSVQRFDVGWDKAIKQTDDDYYRDNPGVKLYGLSNTPICLYSGGDTTIATAIRATGKARTPRSRALLAPDENLRGNWFPSAIVRSCCWKPKPPFTPVTTTAMSNICARLACRSHSSGLPIWEFMETDT